MVPMYTHMRAYVHEANAERVHTDKSVDIGQSILVRVSHSFNSTI